MHLSQLCPAVKRHEAVPCAIVDVLRADHLDRPRADRLAPSHPRFGEVMSRHAHAVAQGAVSYRDPASGYSVFTAEFLARRGYCCASGCRHCPFETR